MQCIVVRARPRVRATNHGHIVQTLPFRDLLAFGLTNALLLTTLGTNYLFADDGFPRDFTIEDATVLLAAEPSQIMLLQLLDIAHVREFMAQEVDGQLSLAKAARSLQDKELEAREAAVRKAAVL